MLSRGHGFDSFSTRKIFFSVWCMHHMRARRASDARACIARPSPSSIMRIFFGFLARSAHFKAIFDPIFFLFFDSLKKEKLECTWGTLSRIKFFEISWNILRDVRVQSWKKKKFFSFPFFRKISDLDLSLTLKILDDSQIWHLQDQSRTRSHSHPSRKNQIPLSL